MTSAMRFGSRSTRDVGERVAGDDDEVGELARRDRAELGLLAEAFGGPAGRRLQRLHRGHPGLDQAFELAGIGRVAVPAGIGAGHHLDPDRQRPLDALDVVLDQRQGALADMRLRRFAVVLVDQQGRHEEDAALGHAFEVARVLVEIACRARSS